MFVVDCPGHGARTLLSVHSICDIDHPSAGVIEVGLRCWCGHRIVHRTGAGASEGTPAHAGV